MPVTYRVKTRSWRGVVILELAEDVVFLPVGFHKLSVDRVWPLPRHVLDREKGVTEVRFLDHLMMGPLGHGVS